MAVTIFFLFSCHHAYSLLTHHICVPLSSFLLSDAKLIQRLTHFASHLVTLRIVSHLAYQCDSMTFHMIPSYSL